MAGDVGNSNLITAFGAIAEMADRLGLVPTIKDRANELFRDIAELKSIRGRSASAIHAACLYIACRQVLCTQLTQTNASGSAEWTQGCRG